jgi:hypothetical protein
LTSFSFFAESKLDVYVTDTEELARPTMLLANPIRNRHVNVFLILLISLIFTSSTYDETHYYLSNFPVICQEDVDDISNPHNTIHKTEPYHFCSDTLDITDVSGTRTTEVNPFLDTIPYIFLPNVYARPHTYRAPPVVS